MSLKTHQTLIQYESVLKTVGLDHTFLYLQCHLMCVCTFLHLCSCPLQYFFCFFFIKACSLQVRDTSWGLLNSLLHSYNAFYKVQAELCCSFYSSIPSCVFWDKGVEKWYQEYFLHSREKPGGTSAFHSSELFPCSLVAKPLLSLKPAIAISFLKPRSESKEISKSPQRVLQCEYQMVSLKSFEELLYIPRQWGSLITVPEMKGLGGLILQLENKLYYVRLKEFSLFSLSEKRWRSGLIMSRCLHTGKRSNSWVFLSLLTKT